MFEVKGPDDEVGPEFLLHPRHLHVTRVESGALTRPVLEALSLRNKRGALFNRVAPSVSQYSKHSPWGTKFNTVHLFFCVLSLTTQTIFFSCRCQHNTNIILPRCVILLFCLSWNVFLINCNPRQDPRAPHLQNNIFLSQFSPLL